MGFHNFLEFPPPPPPLVARTDQDSKWVFQRFSSFQSSRNLCIFFYRVSVCRFIQVSWLTVRYVIVVFSLFDFHVSALLSSYITVI